jgi:hypothetical protein
MFPKLLKKHKKVEETKQAEETFSLAEMKEDGKTYMLRFKNDQLRFAETGNYPYQIGIATPLHSNKNGFPTKEENKQLFVLEALLIKEFAKDNIAVFVGSIVGGGMKEFIFYTGDHVTSVKVFEKMRDQIKHHELECVINNDPDWNNYKMFTGKL